MYKIKTHINPINITCLVMLFITMMTVLTSNKPAYVAPSSIEHGQQDDEYYDTHPLTWRDMKDYQVEIVEGYAIFYNYDRAVFVVPFDKNCNLTKAVERDNQ